MKVINGIAYDNDIDILRKRRVIRELIEINENVTDEKEKAYKFREKCTSYNTFLKRYFHNGKVQQNYSDYVEYIMELKELFLKYEENGLFDQSRNEEKFLLKEEGNLDSRYIINAFIFDYYSYDLDEFCKRYNITKYVFKKCVLKVKNLDEKLYQDYLNVEANNKVKRLVIPIQSINSIIEGIKTGTTLEDNKFDVLEFYKIAPFKGKDINSELSKLEKDYPKLNKVRQYKSEYYREHNKSGLTYAEMLYLFTKSFNEKDSVVLKEWLDANNIKNITPVGRASVVNVYYNSPDETGFGMDDANSIFDYMEDNGYPKIREVYEILKSRCINNKKVSSLKLSYNSEENK